MVDKNTLNEFQADGEASSIADPIETGANDRKADLKKKADPVADKVADLLGINKGEKLLDSGKTQKQAPARLADNRSVKEHTDELFDGEDFSEEFKAKVAAVFEAALIERVNELKEAIEAESAEKLKEEITAVVEQVDAYLDYAVEEWLNENEVAIETNTKVAVAESFMEGLKGLFEEHNVVLPEGGIDVLEGLEARIAELEQSLNESEAKNIELADAINEAKATDVVAEVSEGLTVTQKDRLATLAESIEYSSDEEYRTKLVAIKEGLVAKKKVDGEQALNEEFTGEAVKEEPKLDPNMASYLAAVTRSLKK
jgi:hypothetical protein